MIQELKVFKGEQGHRDFKETKKLLEQSASKEILESKEYGALQELQKRRKSRDMREIQVQ